MPQTKAEKAAYNKQWRIDNAEKNAAYKKQWRIDNIEKVKEHDKQYNIDNREKRGAHATQHYIENAEKIIERTKQYNIDNAENIKQWRIDNPEKLKKSEIIGGWKRKGMIGDLSFIYDNDYLPATNCWVCNAAFKNTLDKHGDHDHSITDGDNWRQVLCRGCNMHDKWKKHSEWV